MCLTPNLVYVNRMLRDKKHPHGVFFSQWSKAQEETFEANKRTLGGEFYKIPCGKCIECRMQKSKEWGMRAFAEYQTCKNGLFLTITYENAPKSLILSHLQKFIKALRNKYGAGVKYIACGEYGSIKNSMRSHYHGIFFNIKPKDLKISKYNMETGDHRILESQEITELWRKGIVFIEQVTFDSCKYVAGYVEKKLTNEEYKLFNIKKPFHIYSKGIGEQYFKEHYKEIYKSDELILPGMKPTKPPRYYDKLLFKTDIKLYKKIKEQRRKSGELLSANPWTDYQYFKIYKKNREINLKAILESKKRNIV